MLEVLDTVKAQLDAESKPAGHNFGTNDGASAGQTVMHLHVHVIPRFQDDVDAPAGGVRFVRPQRGNYHRPGFVPRASRDNRAGA